MRAKNKQGCVQSILLAVTLATAGLLVGCGGERSDANLGGAIKVNTPADITNESAENYDDNVNGLVTYKTLKRWIDDWEKNRPAGIKGKLVIIQAANGPAGAEFIKPNNKNVFTYVEAGWREARSNGVVTIGAPGEGGIVLSGQGIDALVKKYGIDLQNDLIVCAAGSNASAVYMNQGRCWYTFSYWGVAQKNLAVLNGNNAHLSAPEQLGSSYFTSTKLAGSVHPSPIIRKQVSSVKDLKVDNTVLYASLEDLINVLPLEDEVDRTDGVLLWDARSLAQYSAGKANWTGATPETKEVAITDYNKSSFQNAAPRQSHPRGAVHLEFSNVLDMTTGLYHDKQTLKKLLTGEGSAPNGQRFVVGSNETYRVLGNGEVYQNGDVIYHYCETSARAGTALITAAVILGIPSRMYDSGMVEWNSFTSGVKDKNGNDILPAGSPWDTELLSYPVGVYTTYNGAANTANPRTPAGWAAEMGGSTTADDVEKGVLKTPLITNPYALNTNAIPEADKAYKQPAETSTGGSSGGSGSSGGIGLTPSPCGG